MELQNKFVCLIVVLFGVFISNSLCETENTTDNANISNSACDSNETTALCNEKFQLTDLHNVSADITELTVTNASLKEITHSDLERFTKLKRIDFSSCDIESIIADAFSSQTNLEELNLADNTNLKFTKTLLISKSISKLNLSNTETDILPETIVEDLPNLQILDLSSTLIKDTSIQLLQKHPKLTQLILPYININLTNQCHENKLELVIFKNATSDSKEECAKYRIKPEITPNPADATGEIQETENKTEDNSKTGAENKDTLEDDSNKHSHKQNSTTIPLVHQPSNHEDESNTENKLSKKTNESDNNKNENSETLNPTTISPVSVAPNNGTDDAPTEKSNSDIKQEKPDTPPVLYGSSNETGSPNKTDTETFKTTDSNDNSTQQIKVDPSTVPTQSNGTNIVLGIIICVMVVGAIGLGYKYWKNRQSGYRNANTEDTMEEGKELQNIVAHHTDNEQN